MGDAMVCKVREERRIQIESGSNFRFVGSPHFALKFPSEVEEWLKWLCAEPQYIDCILLHLDLKDSAIATLEESHYHTRSTIRSDRAAQSHITTW